MIRRTTKIALEIVAVFVAGLAVGAVFLGWRLSSGPVSVDFLTPYVEAALAAPDDSFTTEIDRTVLRWGGWDRPIQIRALGLRATDGDGRRIAVVPEATVQLSASQLLTGRVVPTGLEVLNPRLRLTRTAEGRFVFGLEGGGVEGGEELVGETGTYLPRLLETLTIDDTRPHLTRLHIVGAHLTITDRLLGASWTAPRADLSFERDTLGVEASLSLALEGPGAPARFDGVALYDMGSRVIDLALVFDELEPAFFLGGDTELGPLRGFGGRIGGTVSAGISLDGEIRGLEFDVSAGAGHVAVAPELGGAVQFSSITARGRSRDGLGRIDVDDFRMELASPGTAATSGPGVAFEEPRPPSLEGAGWVRRGAEETILSLRATLRDLPIARLDEFWPPTVDPGSREWVLKNITAGEIEEVSTSLALRRPAGAEEAEVLVLQGALRYSGLTVRYLEGLPPVTGIAGTGNFDAETLVFDPAGGDLHGMPVTDTTVRFDGLSESRQTISVDGHVAGPVREILQVLDREPFGYARALGLEPRQIGGRAEGRIQVDLPLIATVGFDDVNLRADGRITDFAWTGALFGADVSDGTLDLTVTKDEMRAAGPLRIAGTPARIRWIETLSGTPALPQELTIETELDDAAREAMGLDLDGHLRGPVPLSATVRSNHRDRNEIEAEAELARAAVELPWLGWSKPAGTAGQGRASVAIGGDGTARIERFDVGTAAWSAGGSATVDAAGALTDLQADIAHGPRNDAAVTLETLADGRHAVRVAGRAFDADALIDGLGTGAEADPASVPAEAGLLLEGRLDRLYLGGEGFVADAEVDAAMGGGELSRLALRGGVGQDGRLTIDYGDDRARGERLELSTDDAGAALSAVDITGSVIGGRLEITGRNDPAEAAPFKGTLRMEDFRVRDAPTLAKLVSLSSLAGIADALSGQEGMGFSEAVAPFTAEGGVVTVEDARVIGPDLGFTANGTLDLGADSIDLEGTVVPAYTLNSILGEIPILGRILVGEKNSGVFAATYSLRGPMDDPEISANPLAALTPGFLRGLFDVFSGPGPGTAETTPYDPDMTPSPLD